jgi:deazaflavin-dependent oxidoreductase (nitroreductase family)
MPYARLFAKPFERDQAYRREQTPVKTAAGLPRSGYGPIVRHMKLKDGSSIVADLTTVGRKTGQPRTVELSFLCYQGSFYATSSRVKGKHWCENLIRNQSVEIKARGERFTCIAKQVTDETLRRRILELCDTPPALDRVVFEMKPQ